jgi:outer membrane biosynthesis protein TonB
MKTMMLTLALVPALALAAAAQEVGDQVEVTFASGATLIGKIVATPKTVSAASLTLDLSWEYPGAAGTLSIPKGDVKAIRKVRVPVELPTPPKPVVATPEPPKPPVVTPEPPKPEPAPEPKVDEELKKAKEFYAKYPAPDWSVERRNAIRLKRYRGQVLTAAEREFEAGFALWEKGRAAAR